MNFVVTRENAAAVRAYLTRLVRDDLRLRKALHWRTSPAAARADFAEAETNADLSAWLEEHLSRAGRERLLNSLRVRRTTRDRANWRISKDLYERLKVVATNQGYDTAEDWLDHQLQPHEQPPARRATR